MAALAAAPAALQPLPPPGGACTRPRLHAPQLQRPTRGRAPAAVAGAGAAPVGGGAGESAGAPPPGLASPLADDHLIEDHTAAAAAAPSSNSKPTGNGKPHLPSSIYVPFPKDALPPDGHTLTLKVRPGRRRAAQLEQPEQASGMLGGCYSWGRGCARTVPWRAAGPSKRRSSCLGCSLPQHYSGLLAGSIYGLTLEPRPVA